MGRIEVNGRVKHKSLGAGIITKTNREMTEVLFDDNTIRKFQTFQLSDTTFFVDAEDRIDKIIKIEHITVKNLFNRLDYEIDINTKNNVAIFTAPNGFGKTTIFKLINFLFNPQMEEFNEIRFIPFTSFSCTLNNNATVALSRDDKGRLIFEIFNRGNTVKVDVYEDSEEQFPYDPYDPYDSPFNGPYDVPAELEIETESKDLSLSHTIAPFPRINAQLKRKECNLHVDFIDANRLQKIYSSRNPKTAIVHNDIFYDKIQQGEPERIDFINKACEEMAGDISDWLMVYKSKVTDAKNRLTQMYLDVGEDSPADFESFKKRWNTYRRQMEMLEEIGLLDSIETLIDSSKLKVAYEKKASFLNTYLDAFKGTLEPLLKNYDKLKLFADIFNKRNEITQKTVKFCPTGIKVFSGENEIEIDCLSSGEKNDFVMFYRLIFNSSKYGIVLIDEPEISLHIEWQEEYLDRLLDICKMNSLQAIVATHSPNIINGHFDLFVDKR